MGDFAVAIGVMAGVVLGAMVAACVLGFGECREKALARGVDWEGFCRWEVEREVWREGFLGS